MINISGPHPQYISPDSSGPQSLKEMRLKGENPLVMIFLSLGSNFLAALLGLVVGGNRGTSQAADAQVNDDPPMWWKQELIHAQARKNAKKLEVK